MNPDADKPKQPKKPVTKNWKSGTKRTGDSVKKKNKGIDLLATVVKTHPGEKLHRTEVPYRAYALLRSLNDPTRSPASVIHSITMAFFDECFKVEQGGRIYLTDAWGKLLDTVQQAKPDLAHKLNTEQLRDAFFWQIAGHVETLPHPSRHQFILIVDFTEGPLKGQTLPCIASDNGELTPIPENWQPTEPAFLCLGDRWAGGLVTDYTVANMSLSWPSAEFQAALSSALWEPSKEVLENLRKRRQEKQPPC